LKKANINPNGEGIKIEMVQSQRPVYDWRNQINVQENSYLWIKGNRAWRHHNHKGKKES